MVKLQLRVLPSFTHGKFNLQSSKTKNPIQDGNEFQASLTKRSTGSGAKWVFRRAIEICSQRSGPSGRGWGVDAVSSQHGAHLWPGVTHSHSSGLTMAAVLAEDAQER